MSPQQDTPAAHEDLYMELMGDGSEASQFVLETEEGHPDVELEVESPGKPTRNKLQRAMPDGLLDGIELPDNIDDVDDLSSEDIDLSDVSISDMTFSEESTEIWLDVISEYFTHEYYSRSEVRNIFNKLDDEFMVSAGSYLIELASSSGPVTGFRRE